MDITITPAPFVDAGPNAAVCGNNSDVTLSGNIANTAGTGFWATLGSGVFDDSSLVAGTTTDRLYILLLLQTQQQGWYN